MFIFFVLVFLILILIMTYRIKGSIVRPNTILTVTWCFLVSLSSLGLANYNVPSIQTYFYIISFLFFFNLIYLQFSPKKSLYELSIGDISDQYRYKLIYCLNILSWIYMIPIIFRAYNIISNYGFGYIRNYTFIASDMLVNEVEKFVTQTIIHGIFQATILLAMVNIALNKKTTFLTVCAFINVATYTFVFGGRFSILQLGMYYIISFLITRRINIDKRSMKKISLGLIGILLLIMFFVTTIRGSSSFINSLAVYYIGPFVFLDYILDNPEVFHLNNYLWGTATFGFISEPIVLMIKLFFGLDVNIASYHINIAVQPFYEISPGMLFNALTTVIYPFIRDFGYFGVVIGAGFLSLIGVYLEKKLSTKLRIVYLCLYIHFIYILFNSILKYDLLSYPSIVVLFFIIIFSTRKIKIKKVNK